MPKPAPNKLPETIFELPGCNGLSEAKAGFQGAPRNLAEPKPAPNKLPESLGSISPVSHQYLTSEILVRYWRDTGEILARYCEKQQYLGSISPVSHQYLTSEILVRYW